MTPRLFIDALPILGKGGISNYIRPLIEELIECRSAQWPLELFFRLGFRGRRNPMLEKWAQSMVGNSCVIHTTQFPDRLITKLWENGLMGASLIAGTWADVILATTELVPRGRGSLTGWFVYDLIPLKVPQFFGSSYRRFLETMQRCARRADFIIALSECTRSDIVELLGYSEEKIVVVYPGTNAAPKSCTADQPVPPATTPYILYLGALALNKNVDGLLRIFARCIHDHRLDMNLILTGKDFCGPGYWKSLVSRLGIAERVKFRGWVTDSEKETLLDGASMLWQFSWYEGFGLPVLEAAGRGIPVLCSNRGALPEIIQNPDQEVDPGDETGAAARASDALRSPSVLSEWKARGLRRAAMFTWTKSVHQMTSYIETAIG
jgi:glycosyltransferase involved in cell wall biosynthesis